MPVTSMPDKTLNDSDVIFQCFKNPPAPAAPIYRLVDLVSCVSILPSVLFRPEVMSIARWTPTIPLILPQKFITGDCRIGISTNSRAFRDRFQEVLIL